MFSCSVFRVFSCSVFRVISSQYFSGYESKQNCLLKNKNKLIIHRRLETNKLIIHRRLETYQLPTYHPTDRPSVIAFKCYGVSFWQQKKTFDMESTAIASWLPFPFPNPMTADFLLLIRFLMTNDTYYQSFMFFCFS